MRKSMHGKGHANRPMNNNTYRLRRQVMGFIYEARKLASLPRVDVRITDCSRSALGTARMGDRIIWIPASTLNEKASVVRHVVFHELLHAIYAVEHVNNCPLMGPIINDTSTSQQNALFVKYAG